MAVHAVPFPQPTGAKLSLVAGQSPPARRLQRFATLTSHELALLGGIASRPEVLRAGSKLDGPADAKPRLILSGWACRFRSLGEVFWPIGVNKSSSSSAIRKPTGRIPMTV